MHRSTYRREKCGLKACAECFGLLCLPPARRCAFTSAAVCECSRTPGQALRRNNAATRQIERLLTNVALVTGNSGVALRHGVFLHNEPSIGDM
jgi:hypothetical protein